MSEHVYIVSSEFIFTLLLWDSQGSLQAAAAIYSGHMRLEAECSVVKMLTNCYK